MLPVKLSVVGSKESAFFPDLLIPYLTLHMKSVIDYIWYMTTTVAWGLI